MPDARAKIWLIGPELAEITCPESRSLKTFKHSFIFSFIHSCSRHFLICVKRTEAKHAAASRLCNSHITQRRSRNPRPPLLFQFSSLPGASLHARRRREDYTHPIKRVTVQVASIWSEALSSPYIQSLQPISTYIGEPNVEYISRRRRRRYFSLLYIPV